METKVHEYSLNLDITTPFAWNVTIYLILYSKQSIVMKTWLHVRTFISCISCTSGVSHGMHAGTTLSELVLKIVVMKRWINVRKIFSCRTWFACMNIFAYI